MDQEDIIDALITGHRGRTWIEQHANEFAYNDKDACPYCRNYAAALFRGATYGQALPLACRELREAVAKVEAARHATKQWVAEVDW